MKYFIIAIFAFTALNSFAATRCELKAQNAAVKAAFPRGFSENIAVDSYAQLYKREGTKLTYKVEVAASYSDGASSSEFPSDFFTVVANGTEANCTISSVKKAK